MESEFETRFSPGAEQATESGKVHTDSAQWSVLARVCKDLGKLAGMEASLATSELPTLLLLLIIRIPVLIFLWLGISVTLSWIAFELTAISSVGFIVFVLLQLILFVFIQKGIKRRKYLLTLPEFRKQAARFSDLLSDDDKSQQGSFNDREGY